jgi:hypothetical protein
VKNAVVVHERESINVAEKRGARAFYCLKIESLKIHNEKGKDFERNEQL